MDLKMFKREFFSIIEDSFESLGSYRIAKYVLSISALCLIISLFTGGYYFFDKRKTQFAYQSLLECLTKYDEGLRESSYDWKTFSVFCEQKRLLHANTRLAAYFDLVCTDALLKQNDHEAAVSVMKRALSAGKKNALYDLMGLKCALMQIDSSRQDWQEEGKQLLITLSQKSDSSVVDAALYQLGRYYFIHDQQEEAKKTWKYLVDNYTFQSAAPSNWVARAQRKLNQLL
jgi:tetratricopeptide (TPR) repeat protein